jgi:hypothetical protein
MNALLEDKTIFFCQQNLCFFQKIHKFKLLVAQILICSSKELEFVDFQEETKVLLAEKYSFIFQQSFHVLGSKN